MRNILNPRGIGPDGTYNGSKDVGLNAEGPENDGLMILRGPANTDTQTHGLRNRTTGLIALLVATSPITVPVGVATYDHLSATQGPNTINESILGTTIIKHTVESGQGLSAIADLYEGVSQGVIMDLPGNEAIEDPDELKTGQEVLIPVPELVGCVVTAERQLGRLSFTVTMFTELKNRYATNANIHASENPIGPNTKQASVVKFSYEEPPTKPITVTGQITGVLLDKDGNVIASETAECKTTITLESGETIESGQ